MESILAWLKRFNVSTHTIALIAGVLAAAYGGYQPFHDLVTRWYLSCPSEIQALMGTAVFLFGLYKSGALKGVNMSDQVYCPRCGQKGVAADTAAEHIVVCTNHGIIHKSPLPAQPPAVATEAGAAALWPSPEQETALKGPSATAGKGRALN